MATYWVEAGHGGTDSGTEANPWLTIDQAMAGLGDGDKVWVKSTAAYTETVDIDAHQATWSSPVVFEGHTGAVGDGGQATINGGGARASGIVESGFAGNTNYVFKNFIITNHTSHGVDLDDVDRFTWKNCHFTSNVGNGASVGVLHSFENCKFNSNQGDGVACQGGAIFVGCEFLGNTLAGIDASAAVSVLFCTFYSNGGIAIDAGAFNDVTTIVVNCTIDGDAKDTTVGVSMNGAIRHSGVVVNTIVYDAATGIDFSCGELCISRNNLVDENTADYANGAETFTGEVTDPPIFVNEAGGADYSLDTGSPAIATGFDAYDINGSVQSADIGSLQKDTSGAAAGGLLRHPGTSGGAQG